MNFLKPCTQLKLIQRSYTCIVERQIPARLVKKGVDPRKLNLKRKDFFYNFVSCEHTKKWGNVDLILTEYIEGVGRKGELVNVRRGQAHYELLPSGLAVFPTDENKKIYEKELKETATKQKLTMISLVTRDVLSKMLLEIQMNTSVAWNLKKDFVRIALRYNGVMSENDSIELPENFDRINCDGKNYYTDVFTCMIKINEYMTVPVKCKIVPVDMVKLWEEHALTNRKK